MGQLFASPLLCNVLGQVGGRIDMRTVMDSPGSIFLANLSKGALGDDKANMGTEHETCKIPDESC